MISNEEKIITRLDSIRKALWSIYGLLLVLLGIGAGIGGILCAIL